MSIINKSNSKIKKIQRRPMKNNKADSASTQNSSALRSCFTNCLLYPVIMRPILKQYPQKSVAHTRINNNSIQQSLSDSSGKKYEISDKLVQVAIIL